MGSPAEDAYWMRRALAQAEKAGALGEVPVGAVLVGSGDCIDNSMAESSSSFSEQSLPAGIEITSSLICEGYNCPIHSKDPTAHAEIVAIRNAGNILQNYRLPDTTLYVTIEPCAMCVGAIVHARIGRLVYGAEEPRAGAVKSAFQLLNSDAFNHKLQVYSGVLAQECGDVMASFFKERRRKKKQSKKD